MEFVSLKLNSIRLRLKSPGTCHEKQHHASRSMKFNGKSKKIATLVTLWSSLSFPEATVCSTLLKNMRWLFFDSMVTLSKILHAFELAGSQMLEKTWRDTHFVTLPCDLKIFCKFIISQFQLSQCSTFETFSMELEILLRTKQNLCRNLTTALALPVQPWL